VDQLRALRVFAAIVDAGSLAGAARTLDLAPAVVTRSLAELEQHLGARLLQRTTRRIALTEAGQAYLDSARRVLAEIDAADAQAGTGAGQPRGVLRVVAPPAFAVHQLAKHLPRFRAAHPQLAVEIALPGAVAAADAQFDVSIVAVVERPLQGDFVARRLARSTFLLCAAPRYLQQRGRPADPEGLLSHEALLPAVSALKRELTLFDGRRRSATITTPSPALVTAQLEMLLAAALAGAGIAGLPSFMVEEALRDGRLERVLPSWHGLTQTLFAAMPTRRHVPARTRAFVDFLVQTFGGADRDPWCPEPATPRPAR
jgi:DNA-binding transcriptional LysR family regulator